jgi:hypothetical protein
MTKATIDRKSKINQSNMAELEVWEFNKEIDTHRSYQAFCIYRDLGPGRTIDNAYALSKGLPEGSKTEPSGCFKRWCREKNWDERAKAFDLAEEREWRSNQTKESRLAYEKRLEAIRNTVESIALNRLQLSLIASKIALREGKRIENIPESRFSEKDFAALTRAINLQRADTLTIESALKITDEALDIRGVLDSIKGDNK